MELYYAIILPNNITTTTTTISRRVCSATSCRLVHPNPFVVTHHPSEPQDLPDGPEDYSWDLGRKPTRPRCHVRFGNNARFHTARGGVALPWRKEEPIVVQAQVHAHIFDTNIYICVVPKNARLFAQPPPTRVGLRS